LDNLAGLDFIPAGAINGEKEIGERNAGSWNKSRPGRVYHHEHVHTRRGLVPLSLQARAILPIDGQNVRGDRGQEQRFERREAMSGKKKDEILFDHNHDGIDRRGFLKCMAWAGTGTFCVIKGGVLNSYAFNRIAELDPADMKGELSFAQISDSHMGFNKPANTDVVGTFKAAVDKINALKAQPEFLLHTGDISHLSKPEEFDTVDQILKGANLKDVFYVPGEHDVLNDDGKQFLERYGKGSKGAGWYSFEKKGVHFVGLVNVMNLKAGGLGTLGSDQLEWLEDDVKHLSKSTPIVVFAHIPLWSVYPEWGWGTEDSAQALGYLKKFGSVTVLNGHIHQTMQKVEGNITFHTAASTAFPQPQPGKADSPGPMKVPAEELRALLGITDVNFVRGQQALAIVDSKLG
jgi:3',5'-cyclic-AMP phosphodiesterase